METPKDIVLVSVKQKYNNQIEINDGQVIWLDTSFKPMHHVSICGVVEAVPRMLSSNHYAHGDSTMDLKVGDKVYFHYLTVDPNNLVEVDGKDYYQVDYFNIFCYKRDGKMHMTNEWCLVEPVEDVLGAHYEGTSIIIPEMYRKKKNYKIGKLKKIGGPLRNHDALDVAPEDYVIYQKDSDFENEIEGVVYYTMMQKHLFAVIQEECLKNFA